MGSILANSIWVIIIFIYVILNRIFCAFSQTLHYLKSQKLYFLCSVTRMTVFPAPLVLDSSCINWRMYIKFNLFCFLFFSAVLCGMQDLVTWSGIEPNPLVKSFNHWTAREPCHWTAREPFSLNLKHFRSYTPLTPRTHDYRLCCFMLLLLLLLSH